MPPGFPGGGFLLRPAAMRGLVRPVALALVAVLAIGCTEVPSTPGASGTGQVALASSFSRSATDAYNALAAFGLEVTNVHVRLTAPDGSTRDTTLAFPIGTDTLHIEMSVPLRTAGESFIADLELTNSDGLVLFSGRQQVTARATNIPGGSSPTSVTVSYTGPGRDVKSLAVAPATQLVTGASSIPVTANGLDAAGAAVSNLLVRWTTSDPSIASVTGVSASSATVTTTGKRGVATISAITALGVAGTSTFTVVPPAARVVVISGSGQVGPAGHAVPQPLLVEVQAADNLPVPGAPVTFRALTVGASVGSASAITDAAGRASTLLTVGQTAGAYQFDATSGTLTAVQATATATAAPAASLVYVSGTGQSGPVATVLAQPLVVKVLNEFGAVVGGATVQWSKLSGNGSLGATSSTTAADGTTSITYTLGTSLLTETVRAALPAASGNAVDFSAKPTPGAPSSMSIAGSLQHAPVSSALPLQINVRVTDAYGNPVPNVDVAWRLQNTTGPTVSFAPTESQTDAAGSASSNVTLGGSPGTVNILAIAGGLVRTFILTGDPSTSNPGTVSGFVYDAVSGAPLSGVSVAITQGGQTVMTALTASNGNFATTQLAGGVYDLQYSITGYVSTTIAALTINGNTVAQVVPLVPASSSPGNISGLVYDATTNSVVQGAVTLELRSGVNATTGTPLQTVTATNGASYLFANVAAGTYTIVAKVAGYADATKTGIAVGATTTSNQNIYISPTGVTGLIRIVLTWRQLPSDLDSYLSGPIPNSTSRFLVSYSNRSNCSASPFACLDQDVTSGFGPETVTITQITSGTYYYSVNNYSGNGPLSQSGARVDVYVNNALAQSFFVPSGSNGSTWNVFSLNGTVITPINTYGSVLTSRTPIVPGVSASRIPSTQSATVLPRTDAELIAEMVRRHPKAGGVPR